MKKIYTLAALAMVAIVACNQEIDINNDSQTIEEQLDEVTVTALAPVETKTSVDGLDVKWATGDHVAIFDEDGGLHDFTLSAGAGTTTGTFSGNLGGKSSLGYAVYPYSSNADFDGDVTVDYPDTYAYNAVTVPMWGEEGTGVNVGKYTFDHVGGAFKIRYYNVPASADKFVFTATTNITGTVVYDFTDADVMDNEGKVVTVTDLPASTSLTFIIPVPVGTYSFTVGLKDSSNNDIAGSVKTVSSAKTIAEGHLLPLREIVIPPVPNGTTLFSVDFGDYGTGQTDWTKISGYDISDYADAGYAGRSGIGDNGYVTLSGTGDVKVSTASATGLTSGHIWFKKSADGVVTTSAIKLYGATAFTLSYDQATGSSESIAEYSVDNGDNWLDLGTQSGPGSAAFGATGLSASSILIRIKHRSSNTANTRVDNIVVKAGAPEPGVSVATNDATSISKTGATLNGTISLLYSAVLSSVTEAGFIYKAGAGSYGDPVTVSVPLGSASFSKAISCSDGVTYTYKAYAKYSDGEAVYGEEKSFLATDVMSDYSYTFASGDMSYSTSGTTGTWEGLTWSYQVTPGNSGGAVSYGAKTGIGFSKTTKVVLSTTSFTEPVTNIKVSCGASGSGTKTAKVSVGSTEQSATITGNGTAAAELSFDFDSKTGTITIDLYQSNKDKTVYIYSIKINK